MPDNIQDLIKKISGDSSIASSEATRNQNSRQFNSYNVSEDEAYKETFKQALKQKKAVDQQALAESGVTEQEISNSALASNYFTDMFNYAKEAVNSVFNSAAPVEAVQRATGSEKATLIPLAPKKSVDEIRSEVVTAYNENKAFERALANPNGVKTVEGKSTDYNPLNRELAVLDNDDFIDQVKYSLGIEKDRLGNKKLSISSNESGGALKDWFYYLDKDEQGNDILAKTRIEDYQKFKKNGKTILNSYGPTSFDKGFMREFGAGLSNTYGGLAMNLINANRAAANLVGDWDSSGSLAKAWAKSATEFGKKAAASFDVDSTKPGVGGTSEWLGAGIGQGASSLAQMAMLSTATAGLGRLIAPAASATDKFNAIANFGAGSILNFNEAYTSALEAGLSEKQAASVGALTGAINGIIESSIGTNRMFNYLSGGGDRVLARNVLRELNGQVDEVGINRVFNSIRQGLTGNAASTLNKLFEKPVIGMALEEGTEELFQTFSQKGVENLYDLIVAGDKEKGSGKFGTQFFSKDTFKEAMESAFFGAVLGAAGGAGSFAKEKLTGRKSASENDIIPMIADGKSNEIEAVVKTLHANGLVSDAQLEHYTDRINHLSNIFNENNQTFTALNELENKDKVSDVKTYALKLAEGIFSLNKKAEDLGKELTEVSNNADLTPVEKETKTKELTKAIKTTKDSAKFYNEYFKENYQVGEDGKVQAYENNYLNEEEIINNKWSRFNINEDTKDIDRLISNSENKISTFEQQLEIPENLSESPKEIRAKLEREQLALTLWNNQKNNNSKNIKDLLDNYNTITSAAYQNNLKNQRVEETIAEQEQEAEVTTSTPIETVPEIKNENNTNVQQEVNDAPITKENKLKQQIQELEDTLAGDTSNLDSETINQMQDMVGFLQDDLDDLQSNKDSIQEDYNSFLSQYSNMAQAAIETEEDLPTKNGVLSQVKKEIEQTIAGFKSNGIDVSGLEQLHTNIENELLNIRQTLKDETIEVARQTEEAATATTRDNTPLISNISFFDRVERLPWMNTNPTYYTDNEYQNLLLNTPIEEILANINLNGFNSNERGLTPGTKVGTWNNNTDITVPNFIITIEYKGRSLGNLNAIDSFIVTDAQKDVNLTEEQLRQVEARNIKLQTLLKKDYLFAEDLTKIGFTLNWNGEFAVDLNTPRTLIKDFKAAQLVGKSGKPFNYIIDTVNNREITNLVDTVQNELGEIPDLPDGLTDRYQVLVRANNGKLYWVGAQNQVLSDASQNRVYNTLFKDVDDIKALTDPSKIKEEVSKINKLLEETIFLASSDSKLKNKQLILTTLNATNKNYTLAIKGAKGKNSRVVLDSSKYGTMSDLLEALGLSNTNLRTTIGNTANTLEAVTKLSINLEPTVLKTPRLSFKIDDQKLNDYLISANPTERTVMVEGRSNPYTEKQLRDAIYNTEYDYSFSDTSDGRDIARRDIQRLKTALDSLLSSNIQETVTTGTTEDENPPLQESENPFANYDSEGLDPTLDVDSNNETVDNTINLSQFDPSFNTLSQVDRLQAIVEATPLLEGYDQLSKLKKKGVETKVRTIINKYRPNTDPVFSIGKSEEVMDYPEALNWINNNLPNSISVEDVNRLLGHIKNNGTTFGAFTNNIIYLSNQATVGTQYHEAFHAVFRMLISDKQINAAYRLAEEKYGKVTSKQITDLKNSSSVYDNYTNEQLHNLVLEEKMANEYQQYQLSNDKSTSGIKTVWNKIRNWFNFVIGNMDQLESLFFNISRGKFKNATIQSNLFSRLGNQDAVFQVYKKGIDDLGNTISTTQQEGQGILASLTNKYLQGIKDSRIRKDDYKAKNELLDKLIAEKAKFYSIDENPYYEQYLESKGLMEDDNFIESMTRSLEQKRNIYVDPNNITALKKDILNKSKIFDLDEVKNVEDRQDEIDEKGDNAFETDVWTIGGETSFSKVLKEYISLATINTTDDYGQDVEEAVDFKKVYRGLIRALAGVEENDILPRFRSLAEFDTDINAVFDKLLNDLKLTRESNLQIQDIAETGYDIWRKFVTAFNNENVGWYTILHSREQSRLIASNTNSAKDIQFNDWYQNYNLSYQETKFDPEIRTLINNAADAINRSENIVVTSLLEAKARATDIKQLFRKLSINLSDAYIAYSLIKKSEYDQLDQDAKNMLSAFAGIEGLYDSGNIPFIVTEFKSDYNPFESSRDDQNKERGAVTRLKDIAAQNALFDPTIGENSFQNADGKNVYSIIRPSFGLVKLRRLVNSDQRAQILNDEKYKKDDFINPLDNVTLNHLLANENLDLIMENLSPSMIDGYRQTSIEGDSIRIDDGDGVTFGKFNSSQYLVSDMLMFLSNRKSLNIVNENGKTIKLGESALFNINQMESSNTGYGVFLPVQDFSKVENATDILFNYLAQEAIRITRVKSSFNKEGNPKQGITRWVGYNEKLDQRGTKLMEFAGYELDELISNVTSQNTTAESVYNALLENKKVIREAIENKVSRDISEYNQILLTNGIKDLLPDSELKKRGYLKDEQGAKVQWIKLVTDQYLNAYINTLGINNLLLDNYAKKVKNTVDWYKRAKGIIGSGPDFGEGTTKVAVYKDPVKFIDTKTLATIDKAAILAQKRSELNDEGILSTDQIDAEVNKLSKQIDQGKIDIADAQSYVTLDHKILQLQRTGRFPKAVSDIYNKIKAGEQITWTEKTILEDNNAALNSTKTVAYNGDYYFKLSELVLTPNLVNMDGMEYLKNKYNAMIKYGVDQALPNTASKMATIAPAEFAADGNFDFSNSIMEIENKYKRLQVETPSGKSKIIDGTQAIQLVASEQDDTLEIDFKYNDDVKILGDLRRMYRQLLADNRYEAFKTALAYIQDPLSGEFNSKELTKKFYSTIIESGADEVLSNFFTPDHNGERQFNWNLGPVVNKAEQLFLAHFSKGVLSQKVPGLKVSLVSDTGIQVRDKKTGKLRDLQHMVLDADGNYYSECLLPPFANELLGKDASDERIQEVLKMFGVRIPTDDKHSMIALKVIGFLPVEYGSIGVFPKEIVYLSGADFDIDSEFIHRAEFYTNKEGIPVKYGTAITDESKYEEWKKWNSSNNKLFKHKFSDLGLSYTKSTPEQVASVYRALGMPSSLEEYIAQQPINIGVNNNAMLDAKIKFLTNDFVRTASATTPVSTSSIEESEAAVSNRLGRNNQVPISPNSPVSRYRANRSNMEGKYGIGPVALANIAQAFLTTNNQQLFNSVSLPVINGVKSSGFTSAFTNSDGSIRKTDMMSALLNAMTDNAKLQLADKLTLTFNPEDKSVVNSLPVAAYMLGLGYGMNETMFFLNQASIRAYITGDLSLTDALDDLEKRYDNLVKKELGFYPSQIETKEQKLKYRAWQDENKKPLSLETMLTSADVDINTDPRDFIHLSESRFLFGAMQAQASYVSSISALMSLNKGLKSTFDDNESINNHLTKLGLEFLVSNMTKEVNTYKDLINKLEKLGIVKYNDKKIIVGDNFPEFAPIDVNQQPFDGRLAILNDPNTVQNIIIHNKVMESSKEFFLLKTDMFDKLRAITRTNSKDLIPYFMNKANSTYLEEVFPAKYAAFEQAKSNTGYMLDKSGESGIGRELYKLKKDPNFRNNLLIKILTLKNAQKNSKLVQIEFPTRIKAEGDFYTNLNNAFKELFMNPRTTDFARKLYYYSYFKDGLQFRNKSFINVIPSWVFKDVSASLDLLNEDFKDNNIDDYSSIKEGVVPATVDMLTTFASVESFNKKLPYAGLNFDLGEYVELKALDSNIQSRSIKTKTLDKMKLDFSNLKNYRESLKTYIDNTDDFNAEALMTGINYELAGYESELVKDADGGETPVTKGRLLQSATVFIDNTHKTMSLAELTDLFIRTGEKPIATYIEYRKINPIKESGLNSTIIDTTFLRGYIDNVKALKPSTEPSIVKESLLTPDPVMDDVQVVEEPIENLEIPENNSTFVNNPFAGFNISESSSPVELTAEDYADMINDTISRDDINDMLDNEADEFRDANDDIIC